MQHQIWLPMIKQEGVCVCICSAVKFSFSSLSKFVQFQSQHVKYTLAILKVCGRYLMNQMDPLNSWTVTSLITESFKQTLQPFESCKSTICQKEYWLKGVWGDQCWAQNYSVQCLYMIKQKFALSLKVLLALSLANTVWGPVHRRIVMILQLLNLCKWGKKIACNPQTRAKGEMHTNCTHTALPFQGAPVPFECK